MLRHRAPTSAHLELPAAACTSSEHRHRCIVCPPGAATGTAQSEESLPERCFHKTAQQILCVKTAGESASGRLCPACVTAHHHLWALHRGTRRQWGAQTCERERAALSTPTCSARQSRNPAARANELQRRRRRLQHHEIPRVTTSAHADVGARPRAHVSILPPSFPLVPLKRSRDTVTLLQTPPGNRPMGNSY